MADFLNEIQQGKLKKLEYSIAPKLFRNVFHKDELPHFVWSSMCEIAGVSEDSETITLLSVAFKNE